MLLDAKLPQPALAEYESTLKVNPNRFDSLYGAARAAGLSGNPQKTKDYYGQLLAVCKGASSHRPELAEAKNALDQKSRGAKSFRSRRQVCHSWSVPGDS
jgi:hypothetical protein